MTFDYKNKQAQRLEREVSALSVHRFSEEMQARHSGSIQSFLAL